MQLSDILADIQAQEARLIALLIQWAQINSGSTNLEGLNQMREVLGEAFGPIVDETHTFDFSPISKLTLTGEVQLQKVGKGLWFRKRPELLRRVLLCGHMDTVYPETASFQQVKKISANRLNGPGIADMKGGLVIMLTALQAFETTVEASQMGWDVFINADEELGSLASNEQLIKISQQAQAGLVFEPALDEEGTLARARKGSGHFTLIVKGTAAHAGRNFAQGRNAITLLARAITAIDSLNGQRSGLTLNVGLIQGGEALNQVPALAGAKLEVRVNQAEDQVWVMEQMQTICASLKEPETELLLQGSFHRPSKTITPTLQRFFDLTKEVANSLNLSLTWQDTGGCCDGNNLALHGLPVLDSMGARGGMIHTPSEFICSESLTERAQLTTALLHHLACGGLEELNL
jgi:glutamate carboxypeptidase